MEPREQQPSGASKVMFLHQSSQTCTKRGTTHAGSADKTLNNGAAHRLMPLTC